MTDMVRIAIPQLRYFETEEEASQRFRGDLLDGPTVITLDVETIQNIEALADALNSRKILAVEMTCFEPSTRERNYVEQSLHEELSMRAAGEGLAILCKYPVEMLPSTRPFSTTLRLTALGIPMIEWKRP